MKNKNRQRLMLIDSHAIIHRGYHALPDFTTSKGEPTGALYGLVSMLLRAFEDLKPDYVVACRDLPGPTHRHESYDKYKATRKETEDALVLQLEKAPRVFEALGIPVYAAPGFEADDCLGTIVHNLRDRDDIETIIVSGDMDTLQLVTPHVSVFTLRKGLNDTVLYDSDRVHERYGFGPEHVVDYKALRGDPSDNIPGIRGIGEKTAEQLITEFGSIDDIYTLLKKDESVFIANGIKPRMLELLKGGEKDARFSKELATIRSDAPIDFSLPDTEWRLTDHAQTIAALCDELEFRALKERIQKIVSRTARSGEAPSLPLFGVIEGSEQEDIDPQELKETALALWLLRSDVTTPSLDDLLSYAQTHSFTIARKKIFTDLLQAGKSQSVYDHIEKPLIAVVERMNANGVVVDAPYLKKLGKEYRDELTTLAGRVYQHAGREFNINSPKQLGEVLFDELKLSLPRQKKTATGARTTREDELQKMSEQHPIIADVLAYRELQKLLSTYIDKIIELVGKDGRLRAEFLQTGTTTGRMGCKDPNLQNIPIRTEYGRRIRNAFGAPKGFVLVSLDYSQIELRIAAGLSGDEKLVSVFTEGGDIHAAVAAAVFSVAPDKVDREMRRRAKIINFGILYGMGANALRSNLGEGVSREEATQYLNEYFAHYSGLTRFIERTKEEATKQGYTETVFGRRRYFAGLRSPLPNIRAQAERMAVNAPIQGTQSDIIKLAMVEADRMIEKMAWRDHAHLLLQVHDELVYEIDEKYVHEIAPQIKEVMERVAPRAQLHNVPIVTEMKMGKNWGDMEKLR